MALVLANLGLAFPVTLSQGQWVEQLGFRASQPNALHALVSLFLHWNVLHLLANMLFIATVGAAVEFAAGASRYLAIYLGGGLAGVATHWALTSFTGASGPLVGASGCAAACMGYAMVRYASVSASATRGFKWPIWLLGALWIGLQVVGMFVQLGEARGGVSFGAHLGGIAFGVLASLLFGAPAAAEAARQGATVEAMRERGPSATLMALEQALKLRPKDPKLLNDAIEASEALGQHDQAIRHALTLFEVEPVAGADHLSKLNALTALPSLKRMKAASVSESPLRNKLWRSVAESVGDPERPNALLELAQAEPDGPWAKQLLTEFALHPASDIARSRGLTS